MRFLGGFESTYLPAFDADVAETTQHIDRRDADLALMRSCGVDWLRYPVRWHRISTAPGVFDWAETDAVLQQLHAQGWTVIVDLVHHTSYPAWLTQGFADPLFEQAYLSYVEAFATRYPFVEQYTLFNEPFSTLLLCGHEAIWPPYGKGMPSFVQMLRNVVPVLAAASRLCHDILPHASHVFIDACERHTGEGPGLDYVRYANDRRFFVLDALLGEIDGAHDRPFVDDVLRNGGRDLLTIDPGRVDVVGLDYYAHCQWHFGALSISPTPHPPPLADVIEEYANRYQRPCILSETNVRGFSSDRATWLKYTLEQCEIAVARGVDLRGYCWFPFVDSCDWDSLLSRCDASIDPVGVFVLSAEGDRVPTEMARSFASAARGAPSSSLPAYELQEPVATWLSGYRAQMRHWRWEPAPRTEVVDVAGPVERDYAPLRINPPRGLTDDLAG